MTVINVNGCCLTAVKFDAQAVSFDVLEETRRLTNFNALGRGGLVNLERSLRFDGKVGGHFVTGHVDGQGVIEIWEARGKDHFLKVAVPAGSARYLVQKGSIAIDGISLTVAEVSGDSFAVWIIPHTIEVTCLRGPKKRRWGESLSSISWKNMWRSCWAPAADREQGELDAWRSARFLSGGRTVCRRMPVEAARTG